MSNKTPNNYDSQYSIKHALENLRSHMVDMEAVAHAAEDILQYLPYIPRAPRRLPEPDEEARLNFGRLHAMVVATSSTARNVLQELDDIIERLYRPSSDNGGSSKAGEAWRPRLCRVESEDTASEPLAAFPRKSAKLG